MNEATLDKSMTKAVNIIIELGLTNSQARAYVTLAAHGSLSVADI